MRKFDVQRPGKILHRIQKSFAVAVTQKRKSSLLRRHAVAEKHVNQLLALVSHPPASQLIH